METTLKNRVLTWYVKYKRMVAQGVVRTLDEIKKEMLKEFQKPKMESQCITEIKEIKQHPRETV